MLDLKPVRAALRDFEARQDDTRIRDWQLSVSDNESINIGLKDKEIGGVYAPPTTRRTIAGSLYVVWHDGKVSRSNVNALFLREARDRIARMRRSAYDETYIIEMPEDREPPEVAVEDPEIGALLRDDSSSCFEVLREYRARLGNAAETFNGGVGASRSELAVANSKGLDRAVVSTSHGFSASADSVFGVGYRRRRKLDTEAILARLDFLNEWLPHFHAKQEGALASGQHRVILLPGAAASFLGHYLLRNLNGEAIANKASAWSTEDFEAGKQVFDEGLELRFDPTVDWLSRSYRMDGRGLMSEAASFVEGGRLTRPVVSLKAAQQLSCLPSPVPSSSGLSLETAQRGELLSHIVDIGEGIVVPSVLGMHTQDASRGNYSLSVPSALIVKGGKIVGTTKATLAGNFFDDLGRPAMGLESELDDMVGLSFDAQVNF